METQRQNRYPLGAIPAVALAGVCLFLAVSCRHADKTATEKPKGLDKIFELGPVSVRLATDRSEIAISDRLQFTIEVRSKEGYEAELPPFGEKLEQFGIVDFRTSQPELSGKGEVIVRRTYTLEPFLSGEYKIPAMKVMFRKKGAPESENHEIETEELTITVKSLLPERTAGLKIHDIMPPVDMPRPPFGLIAAATAAGVLALAGIVWFAVRRLRRRGIAARQAFIPPHELAWRELEQLVAEDLIGKGQVKLFYFRISEILRRYIKGRFGLEAPAETSEELLSDLMNHYVPLLEDDLGSRKRLLASFDLVKFAEQQPSTGEIQFVFDSCKEFILETKPAEQATAAG